MHANPTPATARVDWVDYAKGFCIIFVVMLHATLGVEKAVGQEGWMHSVVQFAKPFRMPDFFMISGLFLGLVIDRPWIRYLDRKVVHFLYFYVLWFTIQFAFKAPGWIAEGQTTEAILRLYLLSFFEPFGTLWFIYILPLFFVMTRLLKPLPWLAVLLGAALLEILPVHTGWTMLDETAARYVYFFAGYIFCANIFRLADWARSNPGRALALLAAWFAINGFATSTGLPNAVLDGGREMHLSDLPVISLALGSAGAVAVIVVTALLSMVPAARFLGYIGRNSIAVYLAFFLPAAIARSVLIKFAPFLDIGTVSLLVTAAGVGGPLLLHAAVQWSGSARFLFERPAWARIDAASGKREADRTGLSPAE